MINQSGKKNKKSFPSLLRTSLLLGLSFQAEGVTHPHQSVPGIIRLVHLKEKPPNSEASAVMEGRNRHLKISRSQH